QVLAVQPDFAAAANNLAWLLAEEPEPDLGEALRLAMIAKEQLPDEVHIIDTLGWVHYKRKSYSLARNEFAQAVEKQPDMPILRYHLALALFGEGKKTQAIKELKRTLAGKGDFPQRREAETLLKQWQE
ncbi:MAG TPA: tetratricopeptide repeat protein, partial [Desulfobulbus sp.]|nr:tetratricopeptide repeat protein [Desulfobulbus sp.]